jgi:hypothetical protein
MEETDFPFSLAYGRAETRKACIMSAQAVYEKLLACQSEQDILEFETLYGIAIDGQGKLDRTKVKQLIQVVRPDRQGNLSVLDWCKSCDAVYKEMRFLGAAVRSAAQLEKSYETIINVGFYIVLGTVGMWILGISVFSFIMSLSSILVAFAFMIGRASSQYFEVRHLELRASPPVMPNSHSPRSVYVGGSFDLSSSTL